MERRITLIRHAKSSWTNPDLDDFDRPLNKRGERDAPVMGQRLSSRGARPSLIMTSPALRAKTTALIIAREIGYPREFLQRETELYLADPDTIIAIVAGQDDGFQDIMLVGHNPGLTQLSNRLTGAGIDNVPTCGIVSVTLDVPGWADLDGQRGQLDYFDYPKKDVETARTG